LITCRAPPLKLQAYPKIHSFTKHPSRRSISLRSRSSRSIVKATASLTVATATTTAASLVTYIKGSIDPIILGATASASYKLFLVCVAVGWLLKTNKIPGATASVLSQVSFQLLIPCMLFSKVASTLAATPDTMFLFGMAVAAVTQIIIGAFWGSLLAPLVDGKALKDFTIFGKQPFSPGGSSAAAIASATAAATGLPQAAPALLPRPAPTPPGLRELITAACAFGNSFTLPAVFFLSLLPGVLADQAIAYSGLFLLAWSPCLWSFGLTLVENGFTKGNSMSSTAGGSNINNGNEQNRIGQQPSQQQQQQLTGNIMAMNTGSSESGGMSTARSLESSTGSDFNTTIDLVSSTQPSSTTQLSIITTKIHHLLAALSRFASKTLNPPVLAILIGATVGHSPAGKGLFVALKSGLGAGVATSGSSFSLGYLPFELSLVWAGLKGAYEVIEMLAAGTLAIQTLVLASSLLQPAPATTAAASTTTTNNLHSSNDPSSDASAAGSGMLRALWKALAPSDATEARALAVLSLVRFFLVPTTAILVWHWVSKSGFVGSFASDPLFLFVLAVQSVMPSAQNLIIVLQLSEATRPAAPAFAKLLLKLYAYAVLPVTLWVTAFASRLHIPLV
jgi:predicted permease